MYSKQFYDSMHEEFLLTWLLEPWIDIITIYDEFMMYCMGGEL